MPTVVAAVSASRFEDVWAESALAELREQLRRDGYVQLTGLPDEFAHAEFVTRFGTFMPQYDGRLIWEITPQAEFDATYHSLNKNPLFPHTECYEFPGTPPKYLCLWRVRPDKDGLAMTTLADVRPFLDTLTPDESTLLRTTQFTFKASAGVQQQGLGVQARHPLIEETSDGNVIFRMSLNNLYDLEGRHAGRYEKFSLTNYDTPVTRVLARFERWFDANHQRVRWSRNDFLIWDNQRLVHGRPAFDDPNRLLKRVWLSEAAESGTNVS